MQGFFNLRTPSDLLDKLRREFKNLRDDPTNVDQAFNFFVTAEHMLDWLHPGRAGKDARRNLRDSEPILRITSSLANGAKHFDLLEHHRSVQSTDSKGGHFSSSHYASGHYASGHYPKTRLVITLNEEEDLGLGKSVTAGELAKMVLEYWQSQELRDDT